MSESDRQRRLALEQEIDELTAQVLTMWRRLRRVGEELAALQDEANDRVSQSAMAAYRDELPSETKFSIRAPGAGVRVLLKNARPSAFLVVLAVILVLGVIALVWVLKR